MSKKEDNAIFIEKNLNKINKKYQKMYESKIQDLFERKKSVTWKWLIFVFQCSKISFIWIFEDWLTKPEPIWNVSKYTFTIILDKEKFLTQI